jgi:hypothetical protein
VRELKTDIGLWAKGIAVASAVTRLLPQAALVGELQAEETDGALKLVGELTVGEVPIVVTVTVPEAKKLFVPGGPCESLVARWLPVLQARAGQRAEVKP